MRNLSAFSRVESASDDLCANVEQGSNDEQSDAPYTMYNVQQQKPYTEQDKIREKQAQMMVCDL